MSEVASAVAETDASPLHEVEAPTAQGGGGTFLAAGSHGPAAAPPRPARTPSPALRMLALQRGAGNAAVSRTLQRTSVQPSQAVQLSPTVQLSPEVQLSPAVQRAPTTVPDPSSGKDWGAWLTDGTGPNLVRSGLEITRPIPVVGIFTGMAADFLNTAQDLDSLPKDDAPFAKAAVGIRDLVMIFNNFLGALAAIDMEVQDAATALAPVTGGVTAVADAVTAPVDVTLKTFKVGLDSVQLTLDLFIAIDAGYQAHKAPAGSDSQTAWNAIMKNYIGNLAGDTLTTIIDGVDLASAGLANGEVLKGAGKAIFTLFKDGSALKQAILGILQGWFGVYGSHAVPGGFGPDPVDPMAPLPADNSGGAGGGPSVQQTPVQRMVSSAMAVQLLAAAPGAGGMLLAEAKQIMLTEIAGMQGAWQLGDAAASEIGELTTQLEQQAAQMAGELNDGKNPLVQMRDAAHAAVARASAQIGEVESLAQMGGTAKDKALTLNAALDGAIAGLGLLIIPEMHLPKPMDDDDTGSTVVNAAASMADSVLQRALSAARDELRSARGIVEQPIVAAKGQVSEVAEFGQFLQEFSVTQAASMRAQVDAFNAQLAKVDSLEGMMNLVLAGLSTAFGADKPVTVDMFRQMWNDIPATLDQASAWVAGLGSGAAEPGDAGGADASFAPPPDEPTP